MGSYKSITLSIGYQRGDSIAIFMENHPKFMVVLLALAKIGVVAALINCNLTDEGLSHSINIAKCRGCVYQHKLENVLAQVATNLIAPIDKSPFQVITLARRAFTYDVDWVFLTNLPT